MVFDVISREFFSLLDHKNVWKESEATRCFVLEKEATTCNFLDLGVFWKHFPHFNDVRGISQILLRNLAHIGIVYNQDQSQFSKIYWYISLKIGFDSLKSNLWLLCLWCLFTWIFPSCRIIGTFLKLLRSHKLLSNPLKSILGKPRSS